MRALILEGKASRGSLAAARSLGRAGWEVGLGRPPGHSLAAASTAVRHTFDVPPLEDGVDAYLDTVARIVEDGGYQFVLGAGDAEVLALSAGRAAVPAVVPHPDYDALVAAMDKLRLHEVALSVGLSSPATEVDLAGDTVSSWLRDGPVVVKPRLHWHPERPATALRVEAGLALTADDVRRLDRAITAAGGTAVAQRFVPGRLRAYVTVRDENGCVAQVQQRAVHTWPAPVGISARAVTEPVDPELAAASHRLLDRLAITGLAELQFLVDSRGRHHLIDLNARFYGSLQLAIAAGSDLPRIWAEVALGRRGASGEPTTARPHVRYQWLEGDLRRSAAQRDVRGAVGCLVHAVHAHHSVWNGRDPRPGLSQILELARRAWRRRPGGSKGAEPADRPTDDDVVVRGAE
jgi:predicted ATP-grasp superfamily ATP-dependent carboligase